MFLTNVSYAHPHLQATRWHDQGHVHRRVMALFGDLGGDSDARSRGEVLYRAEPEVATGRLLVQSNTPPVVDEVRTSALAPLLSSLHTDQPVRFRLDANPVRTVNRTGADGVERTRRAQVAAEDLPGWLADRLGAALAIDDLDDPQVSYRKSGRAKLVVASFRGSATVVDPEALNRLIRDGVGRAKAYGCGLLSVVPVG